MDKSPSLPAIAASSFGEVTSSVHAATRAAILDGTLEPGQRISQNLLAQELGVSRTPLREALRLLEREGLVVFRGAHRLVEISPLSMPELDELYALRVAGEAIALRLSVPTLRTADIEALRDDIEIMASLKNGPTEREAHRRFHAGLRSGVGDWLAGWLDVLFEHAGRYQMAYLIRGGASLRQKNAEHRAILRACERGRIEEAVSVLTDHMASTAQSLMAAECYAPRVLPDAVARAKLTI
jgi:DNA-binding GntR family transcriptional regulator